MEGRRAGGRTGNGKVAVDGNITTSRGVGTAIAFAAARIEQLESKEKAEEIKKSIIYGHFS